MPNLHDFIKGILPEKEEDTLGLKPEKLEITTGLDSLGHKCTGIINQAIHMQDFPEREMQLHQLLRELSSTLREIVTCMGDAKGYQGVPFGREAQYRIDSDKKSILKWIASGIHNIVQQHSIGHNQPETWQRILIDILATIESMVMMPGENS